MKKNKGGVLMGTLVGAALGAAAGILLAPESGKKIRKDIKNKSAEFYAYLAPQLKKIKKLGQAEFKVLVENTAKNYSKAKKLSLKEEKVLIERAQNSWNHLKRHLS